jgi:hypothetical protein
MTKLFPSLSKIPLFPGVSRGFFFIYVRDAGFSYSTGCLAALPEPISTPKERAKKIAVSAPY